MQIYTFYGLKKGQHAYKAPPMPINHRFMLKIARKTHNFAIFHLFLVYFFPQTGPRPIFLPPPQPIIFWSIYIRVTHIRSKKVSKLAQSAWNENLREKRVGGKNGLTWRIYIPGDVKSHLRLYSEIRNVFKYSLVDALGPEILQKASLKFIYVIFLVN